MFLPFPCAFSSSKEKLKHINKYKKKERKKERNKTDNSHKILYKRRDRTLKMRVGLNDLVVEKTLCVLSLRKNKNRETIMEEKEYYS